MKEWHDGGVAEVENYQGQRLLAAAMGAFGQLGFQVRDQHLDAWRGASLTVVRGTVAIAVDADWLERELAVSVRVAGAGPLPVEVLIPELRATLRLPRDATRGVLQRRLERVARALESRMPEVLGGGQPALDRVLRAGAKAE